MSLNVYGWTGWRNELPPSANGGRQTREILLAKSVAEVCLVADISRSTFNHNGCVTGNDVEIALAVEYPGVILFSPFSSSRGTYYRIDEDGQMVPTEPDPNLMRLVSLRLMEKWDRLVASDRAELADLRERGYSLPID